MDASKLKVVAVKLGGAMRDMHSGVGYVAGHEVAVTVSDGRETRTISGYDLVRAVDGDDFGDRTYSRLHREAEAMLRRNRMGREIDLGTGAAIG